MALMLSVVIFLAVYAAIATDIIDKTIAAILGAALIFVFDLIPYEHAIAAVDFNVIFLLVGMMTCVFILSQTGFFEWVAILVAKHSRGNPIAITMLFLVVTALLSSVLDNVTTVILLAPVTILISQLLEINPVPLLILEALASNIGGTATLIGDPPNIIIGSQAHFSFNDFLFNLAPVVLVAFAVFLGTVFFLFRRRYAVSPEIKKRVIDAEPWRAVIDRKNMIRALLVLSLIFLGFMTHELTGVENGIIALSGSMIMLLVCRAKPDKTFMHVEWGVIFFFIGLFMIVGALEYNGAIEVMVKWLVGLAGNNHFLLCMCVLAGSAVLSAVLDNIPFVITMVPMLKKIIQHLAMQQGLQDPTVIREMIGAPLWWALALGACLGGCGTLIGASANVIIAKISERNNYPISFFAFTKYGFPVMLQAVIVSGVYLWLRYFLR